MVLYLPLFAQSKVPASTISACERIAVAAKELRRRMHDDMRAPFEGPDEVGGRQRVVDDQRNAGVFGDARDAFEIADHAAGIGDAFAEDRARLVGQLALETVGIGRIRPTSRANRIS